MSGLADGGEQPPDVAGPGVPDAAGPGVPDAAPPGEPDAAPPGEPDAAPSGEWDDAGPASGGLLQMSEAEFEGLVADGLDALPEAMVPFMSNVVVLVADEPPDDMPDDLFGVYEGTPLTERDSGWDAGALPDRITIFRGPTLRHCSTREEVADEVATTVVHEVAHHFGVDDDRLHELGWG